jgi:cephalosporin-C deacetylase-like acetyl esterase
LKVTAVDPKERDNVSDEVFKIYKTFYDYDPTPLNAVFISGDNSNPDWIHERVEIDAAYGNERIILHLFLPKNAKPPFQTVLYGPGSASFFQLNSNRIAEYYEFPVFLDFIVRSGRAVVYPVIQGTFERRKDILSFIHKAEESLKYTEFITQVIKDYRRSIDYLVTRNDIDPEKIAFYGMSWGPTVGTLLSGVETRIKANVFISGGIDETGRSEVNPWKFASRVKVPTLMINGRFDSVYPISLCIEPFYSALGAEEGQKKLALFDTDHIPPREGMVAETLEWFDKHLK